MVNSVVPCNIAQLDVAAAGRLQYSNANATVGGQNGSKVVQGFEIAEPPVEEAAAAERQAGIARIMAGYLQHLQQRTAYHLGTYVYINSCMPPSDAFHEYIYSGN